MPSYDEVFAKVKEVLIEALVVDEEDVKPEAALMGDLGAESIDFLDISFQIDKAFNIKIPKGELFPESSIATMEGMVVDGKVTPAGIEEMRKRLPFADIDSFAKNPTVENASDLVTVDMICKFLVNKLNSAAA
jgi:acyl carrier protein